MEGNKMAIAYAKDQFPESKIVYGSFRFCHSGSLYSYVDMSWKRIDHTGEVHQEHKQLNVNEFFDWLGGQILQQ